jgi:hypothetical protein
LQGFVNFLDDVTPRKHTKNSLFWGPKTCLVKKTTHFYDLILTPAKPRSPKKHSFPKIVPEQALAFWAGATWHGLQKSVESAGGHWPLIS